MEGHRCVICGCYWASGAGQLDRFVFITTRCPDCLDNAPRMAMEPLTGPHWHGLLPEQLEARTG